jgi:hypothetical protein
MNSWSMRIMDTLAGPSNDVPVDRCPSDCSADPLTLRICFTKPLKADRMLCPVALPFRSQCNHFKPYIPHHILHSASGRFVGRIHSYWPLQTLVLPPSHRQRLTLLLGLRPFSHMQTMDTLYPISLPYGLSAVHREIRRTGKGLALPVGDHRFFIASLQELCPPCPTNNPPGSCHPASPRASRVILGQTRTMGMHFKRRRISLPLRATEKRDHTPKLHSKQNRQSLGSARGKESVLGTGTRLRAGDKPGHPLLIGDSDHEDYVQITPLQRTRNSRPLPKPLVDTADWLKGSIRPAVPTAVRDLLGHYRYAPSTVDSKDMPINQATKILKSGCDYNLKGELSSFQDPIPSGERTVA